MPAVLDADQRHKLEEALIRKAQDLLREMRLASQAGQPDTVEEKAQTTTELLKTREFPSQRATEVRETMKGIQRAAFQLSVDTLLRHAERRGHAGDDKGRNEFLTKAKDHFAKALRYGADDEFRHGVERRVQAALMTTADGVDERTKKANAHKLELRDNGPKAPNGKERRRCIRYADPPLSVAFMGLKRRTVNWSNHGVLVESYNGELPIQVGDRVKLDLGCDELPGRPTGRQPATVVRIDRDRRTLALTFPEISTVVLDLVHAMKAAGMRPEAER